MSEEPEEQERENDFDEAILDSLAETGELERIGEETPEELPLIPLSRRPFFPGMAVPIVIEPGVYYDMLTSMAKSGQKFLGLVLTKDENADVYKAKVSALHKVGVIGRILRIIPIEKGGAQVVLNIERRFRIKSGIRGAPFLSARIKTIEEEESGKELDEVKAYSINIVSTIKDLLKLNPLFKEELQVFLGHSDFTEPGKLADFAVALTTATREELQDVLETIPLQERIDKALILLRKELDLSKIQSSINQKIESSISRTQKEFFLKEQLRTIKKELGIEKDDRTVDIEKFESRLEKRVVPEEIAEVIRDEMEKLSTLESFSAEYSVCRNYLDWLTILPWGLVSEECHDLKLAQSVLDEDHYGLDDIKERIIEFISVGKLAGGVRGSIIGLVGPPGVGKTSVGRSVARALGRKFYRFSVGGMRDEVEIKGHRRTYVGAMPGKLIQALKYCQTTNPVIMLDEVDKMGRSFHGDPASALLEVLDPEQNREFLDHYLDVRVDLSNVLFIVTANVLDMIPEPLRDRMDVLRMSGYVMQEKLEIANRYLIPKNRKEMGIRSEQFSLTSPAVRAIVNGYARESGVRSLEHNIKKVMRKAAVQLVRQRKKKHKIGVNLKNLSDFLGQPIYTSDRFYEKTPIGVATGLAWTSLGGATLYVESIRVPAEKTEMKLTGQVGAVMRESCEIAWTYLHGELKKLVPRTKWFEKCHVHLHIPEGATPKDGPSAGITMVTAMLSLLLNRPVLEDLGMTGELTLNGRVLPIGGLKEKLIASRRSGLTTLIFPKDNLRDYEELPQYLKKGIKTHFVTDYHEVFDIAFPKPSKGH